MNSLQKPRIEIRFKQENYLRPKSLRPVGGGQGNMLRTVALLTASNIFMTTAWYYHLKHTGWPLWKAIALSWLIALFEYCLMVPANRIGYVGGFSAFQLKMVQEVITLVIFSVFAVIVLKEPFQLKYLVSFIFLLAAVYFMFRK
jgi:uncharacterized protein (DUF486 family)